MMPGERVTQDVNLGLKLRMKAVSNTSAIVSTKQLDRTQRRHLEILEREDAREPRAKVAFERSDQCQKASGGAEHNQREPVTGKTYLVVRRGEELLVSDLRGRPAPTEECDIVKASMEGFGRANPLSEFMNDRTLTPGETLQIPNEVGEQIFSAWREMLEISQFSLTLSHVETVRRRSRAVFRAVIQAHSPGDEGHLAELEGQIVIEPETCRVTEIELSGPIRWAHMESGQDGTVKIDCQGTVYAVMRSTPTLVK
jgi:hypothetical protein